MLLLLSLVLLQTAPGVGRHPHVDGQLLTIRTHDAVGDEDVADLDLGPQRTGEACGDDPLRFVSVEQRLSRSRGTRLPTARCLPAGAGAYPLRW